ncbi:MAG: hypothetical protein WA885_09195 [Phormidesmis sp.]
MSVISLNCLLAGGVLWLAYRLWQWRCELAQLTAWLQNIELMPKEAGYALVLGRSHIAQTRLMVALWQRRSQQIQQGIRALLLLRSVQRYRRRGGSRRQRP